MLPARPSCVHVLSVIDWYVDCECDVSTMLAVAAHLDRCPRCAEQLSEVRWLKSAVRRCGGGSRAPGAPGAPESPPWP